MSLIPEQLEAERDVIFSNRVKIRVLGEVNTLPLADRVAVQAIVKQTVEHDALTLNIAFNYGGRAEILRAVGHLIRDGVAPDDVSEEVFASYLYTPRAAGAGFGDPHRWRAAAEQLPHLAGRLR